MKGRKSVVRRRKRLSSVLFFSTFFFVCVWVSICVANIGGCLDMPQPLSSAAPSTTTRQISYDRIWFFFPTARENINRHTALHGSRGEIGRSQRSHRQSERRKERMPGERWSVNLCDGCVSFYIFGVSVSLLCACCLCSIFSLLLFLGHIRFVHELFFILA